MADKRVLILGVLSILILSSGAFYVTYLDKARIKVDYDKTSFYQKHPEYSWIWQVTGTEQNRLFAGASIMNRDAQNVKIENKTEEQTIYIIRTTPYIRGPIIVDTYYFRGDVSGVEQFPFFHKAEIYNGTGYFYRYTADNLFDAGPKRQLTNETILTFGKNMKVELQPGYRWAWVGYPYGSDSLSAQYDIKSDYEVYYFRVYDPIEIEKRLKIDFDATETNLGYITEKARYTPVKNRYWRTDGKYDMYDVYKVTNNGVSISKLPNKFRDFTTADISKVKANETQLYAIVSYKEVPEELVEIYCPQECTPEVNCSLEPNHIVCGYRNLNEGLYDVVMTPIISDDFSWDVTKARDKLFVMKHVQDANTVVTWGNPFVKDPTGISECGTIASTGQYELNTTISSNSTCITITTDNVEFTCNSSGKINYAYNSFGYGINLGAYDNITIKNCNITQSATLSPQWVAGVNGTALDFDGVDDYGSASGTVNKLANNFSVSLFVYADSLSGTLVPLSMDNENTYAGWRIQKRTDGTIRLYLYASYFEHTTKITAGTWYHLAFVVNETNVTMYVNGVNNTFAFTNNLIYTASPSIYIGRNWDTGTTSDDASVFNGKIDQVAIWNRTLNITEIQLINSTHNVTNATNLTGFWQFEQGTGIYANDSTSYGNNFTLTGTGYADSSHGIYQNGQSITLNITNNTFVTGGTTCYAIRIYGTSTSVNAEDIFISNNMHTPIGTTNYFAYLDNANNIDIFNNTYNNLIAASTPNGVYINSYGRNIIIRNNNITATSTSTTNGGILLYGVTNATIYGNWIRWYGASTTFVGAPIRITSSSDMPVTGNMNIYNNTIITGTALSNRNLSAIAFTTASGQTINNITFSGNSYSTEGTLSNPNRYFAYFMSPEGRISNITFANETITGTYYKHIHIFNNVNVTLINATGLAQGNITFNSTSVNDSITIKWYARVNITNSTGGAINETLVNITSSRESYEMNNMNDGTTVWIELTELTANGTFNYTTKSDLQNVTYYESNWTASKTGYTTNSTLFNITQTETKIMILETSVSGCTCPDGTNANWSVDMSLNCVLNTDCNLGAGNLTYTNQGNLTINATLTLANIVRSETNQSIWVLTNGLINITG